MADIVFIAIVVGFFAICAAYVRGLDRLVRGAAEAETVHAEAETSREEVAQ